MKTHATPLFPELHNLLTPLGFKLRSFHEFLKCPDRNLVYTNGSTCSRAYWAGLDVAAARACSHSHS